MFTCWLLNLTFLSAFMTIQVIPLTKFLRKQGYEWAQAGTSRSFSIPTSCEFKKIKQICLSVPIASQCPHHSTSIPQNFGAKTQDDSPSDQ